MHHVHMAVLGAMVAAMVVAVVGMVMTMAVMNTVMVVDQACGGRCSIVW